MEVPRSAKEFDMFPGIPPNEQVNCGLDAGDTGRA